MTNEFAEKAIFAKPGVFGKGSFLKIPCSRDPVFYSRLFGSWLVYVSFMFFFALFRTAFSDFRFLREPFAIAVDLFQVMHDTE